MRQSHFPIFLTHSPLPHFQTLHDTQRYPPNTSDMCSSSHSITYDTNRYRPHLYIRHSHSPTPHPTPHTLLRHTLQTLLSKLFVHNTPPSSFDIFQISMHVTKAVCWPLCLTTNVISK